MTLCQKTPLIKILSLLYQSAEYLQTVRLGGAVMWAAALGAMAALSMAPVHLTPLMIIGLTGLYHLLCGAKTLRQAALLGFCFGLGFFALSLYWVNFALMVPPGKFVWLIPVSAVGLPSLLAIFFMLPAILFSLVKIKGWRRIILFCLLMSLGEYVRGHVLTGFPWNLVAHSWQAGGAVSQGASVVGVYGLGLLTLLMVGGGIAVSDQSLSRLARRVMVCLAVSLFIGLLGVGTGRLMQMPNGVVDNLTLRLVQPSIEQSTKWDKERRRKIFMRHLELSIIDDKPADIWIWPESAIPFLLKDDSPYRSLLAKYLPENSVLLTGIPTWDAQKNLPKNSMLAINDQGQTIAHYDKFHLVPFGEYMPFAWLAPIAGFDENMLGFLAGPGPQTLYFPDLPHIPAFSPLICYEIIFPGAVTSSDDGARNKRPSWLLNLTNDGWYGRSAGPHQHLAMASWRAIEEGIPVVRVANNGISAVIGPDGRIRQSLKLNEIAYLDADLPRAIEKRTIFSTHKNLFYFTLFILLLFLLLKLNINKYIKS